MANCLTVRDVAAGTFCVGVNTAGKCCDDPQHGNLYEEEDNSERVHDVPLHDNLYEEAGNSETLHGAFPHDNPEVLGTLKDDSWVALEASRHGSLEV